MKRILFFMFGVFFAITYVTGKERVLQLDLNDEIGALTWRYTHEAMKVAGEKGFPVVLVKMNTYGGAVQFADSIRTALLHYPGKTVAFIDNNAASAGALIALACDSVYMMPDASMGAATVVNGGNGEAMPDKYQSYMRAMMRATAESHGRDSAGTWRRNPLIAEAMVDTRIVVDGLIDSTKVLTFTASEAVKWGFCDGIAKNVGEVMEDLKIEEYVIDRYEPGLGDKLIGFLTNPAVQAVLITIIIAGIYFELQTPGLGFPTVAAVMAAVVYFLPMLLDGVVAPWIALLFVGGLLLFLLEIFVIPGFGVAGIGGIVCMGVAVFVALVRNFELTAPAMPDALPAIWQAVLTIVMALLVAVVVALWLTSRYGPEVVRKRSMLLHSQKVEDGYVGIDATMIRFVGKTGVAVTDLRPSGKVSVEGERVDAVSADGFIEAGEPVRVVKFENAQVYVLPVSAQ